MIKIEMTYFASLKDVTGKSEESIETESLKASDLYNELNNKYVFPLSIDSIKLAINDNYCDWDQSLENNDRVVFITPVSGG